MRALRIARGAACWALLLALAAGAAPAADAQEAALRGKISYQLGYGYTEEELVENALCAELDVERRFGSGKVHIGLDAAVRAAVPAGEETASLELDEAYADVYLDAADLRIGRQVISWGTADGFNPTNVVNPRGPLSPASLLLSGAPPKGEPVTAVQLSYYLPSGASVTGVGVAHFVPAPGGRKMLEAIAAKAGAQAGGEPLPIAGPDPVQADGSQFEWAVRGEALVGGHNVYVSYFRGWDDYPAAWVESQVLSTPMGSVTVPRRIAAEYRRVHKLGVATAGTVGDAGLWTEIAYTAFDEVAALEGPGALSSNEPYVEAVVGADYTFKNGVTLSGQVIYHGGGSLLTPYKEPGADVEPQTYFAAVARYSPRPGRELQGVALVNLTDGGTLAMGRYAYELTQSVSLTAGLSHVFAGEESEFHAIKSAADMVTAGIEISF